MLLDIELCYIQTQSKRLAPGKVLRNSGGRERDVPHGNHLCEATGFKHGGHQEHVRASINQVAQRLVICKPEAPSVRILPCNLTGKGIELSLS